MGEVRSFHRLASFYRSPLNEIVKKKCWFKWEESQERAFQSLKERLTQAPILALPKFSKSFELECDASNVSIRIVLLQERHTIAYSIYDQKLYAFGRDLHTWKHYLLPKDFVIHSDHEALKHLRRQGMLRIEFLEKFPYVIKHKQGKMIIVVDALSRRHALISMLETKLLGLDCIKELYEKDIDFCESFPMYVHSAFGDFFRHNGFLFKGKRLYVPMSSIRKLLMKEAHKGGHWITLENLRLLKF
ncbi:Retrovirus-related Pol polyprotein from transposon 17.6, partial [Mucuna pruriens]